MAALVLAAVTGCGMTSGWKVDQPESAPTVSTNASPEPSPSGAPERPSIEPGASVADGMNVRYLDEDGNVKVLKVKDFPR